MNHEAEAKDYFKSRMQAVREALSDPDKQDELFNDCLAVETEIVIDIQLSTGGPGDGFKIICDSADGQPLRGLHYFMQWGFRKEVLLSQDELADVCAAYCIEDARQHLK